MNSLLRSVFFPNAYLVPTSCTVHDAGDELPKSISVISSINSFQKETGADPDREEHELPSREL